MKLAPSEFWSLSLGEWRWLLLAGDDPAMTKTDLHSLLSQFPDDIL